jgi:chorismate mutase
MLVTTLVVCVLTVSISLVNAAKTLTQVRDELAVFQTAILNVISTRSSLGKYTSEERKVIYSVLGAGEPFSSPPPDKVFYGDTDTKATPYIFYSSNKIDRLGKSKKSGDDEVFGFVTSQFSAIKNGTSPSTLLSRASLTTSLLALTSERIALGVDIANAKLASSNALQQATSPIIIRQMLTNKTQEEVVRSSVSAKSASLGIKEFDTVGLFNM